MKSSSGVSDKDLKAVAYAYVHSIPARHHDPLTVYVIVHSLHLLALKPMIRAVMNSKTKHLFDLPKAKQKALPQHFQALWLPCH